MTVPVARYIDAPRHPDLVMALRVIEESLKCQSAAGPPGQAAMQADRHHLGRPTPSLLIKAIECVLQIGEELIAAIEALRRRKTHVIGIERIRNDEMPAALRPINPIRQIIGI